MTQENSYGFFLPFEGGAVGVLFDAGAAPAGAAGWEGAAESVGFLGSIAFVRIVASLVYGELG